MLATLFSTQITRAHSSPSIGFRTMGAGDYFDWKIQVRTHGGECWPVVGVLLPEEWRCVDDVNSLRRCGYARKMAGSRSPIELSR